MKTQIQLPIALLPKKWYNVSADLPGIPKWKVDDQKQMETFKRVRPKECVKQEFSKERWIRIPEEVRELYIHVGRPYPLNRARRLEQFLKTPARIYYKREDCSPTGAYKINMTLPQCYYALKEGYERVVTSTGAGQAGTAVAYAAALNRQKCAVYWIKYAYDMKPERRALMRLYGAEVYATPSTQTEIGRKWLEKHPGEPAPEGMILAETLEDTLKHEDTCYPFTSYENSALMYCSIGGLETKKQLELVEEEPDIIISCLGMGANFTGIISPFVRDVLKKKLECRFLGSETASAPKLTDGKYRYEYIDHDKKLPARKSHTIGLYNPLQPDIYAAGLKFHCASPILSRLKNMGLIDTVVYPSDEKAIFEALSIFLRTEGFLAAPESGYSIRAAIDEALKAKKRNEEEVIVANISGHGWLDFKGYMDVLGLK